MQPAENSNPTRFFLGFAPIFHRGKLLGYFMVGLGLPIMLKEEDKVFNMEDIGVGENVTDAFLKISSDVGGNSVFNKRLIGVLKGLIDDGVL